MKTMKKWVLLLLSVLLLTGILASQAFAAEEAHLPFNCAVENPMYPDSARVDAPVCPTPRTYARSTITYCSNISEAETVLREGLKDRLPEVYIYMDNWNVTEEFLQTCFYRATNHTGFPDEGDYLYCHLAGADIYATVGDIGYILIYVPYYLTDASHEAAVDRAVDKLLDELDLWDASNYEKVCGIYQWMCQNIYYDEEGLFDDSDILKYTAYDAIVNRSAVCQGYASLFYRLALELGVDARIIDGEADGAYGRGAHAWNIVHLRDKFYYLDATWDATYTQAGLDYEYFLRGSNNFCTDHYPADVFYDSEFQALYPIDTEDYVPDSNSGTCGKSLTWFLDEFGTLTISGTGDMTDYYFDAPWDCTKVKSVVIENGVTSIGSYAFAKCTKMTEIAIPESVVKLGNGAFRYCSSLASVEIPEGVSSIQVDTFYGCSSLVSISIPESVNFIGSYAFQNSGLTSITFCGDAPVLNRDCFASVTATVYYPDGNDTWTRDVMQNYGGTITWAKSACDHNYEALTTLPTCAEAGYITYTCSICGDTYTEGGAPAAGHSYGNWYISKQPTCNAYGQASKDCVNCEDAQHIELQKADHVYEAVVTAPAVGQPGFTTYTCTGCGNSYVDNYTDALTVVAQIGDAQYATVAEALANAKSGDVVTLIADSHEENTNLIIDEGVTLNIGKYDLYARSLNVLTGAMITGGEYSQNGDWGKIYLPAASRMVMSGMVVENDGSIGLIPVWDDAASCYVFGGAFFNPSNYIVAVNETAKTLSFKFIPSLRTKLMQGYFQDANEMRDNGLRLVLRLTWPGADENGNINGQAQQDFVYSSEFVKTYMDKLGSARFTFLLTGYDTLVTEEALAQMTITPMFIADNGMIFAGQTVEPTAAE